MVTSSFSTILFSSIGVFLIMVVWIPGCSAQERKEGDSLRDGSSDEIKAVGEKAKKHCEEYKKLCPLGGPPPSSTNIFAKRSVGRPEMVEEGVPAKRDEFPHMAAIGYGDGKDVVWLCEGALISENYVLTAARCVNHWRRGPTNLVRLGAEVLGEDTIRGSSLNVAKGQTHRILESIIHPGYRSSAIYDDVALLKIDGSPVEGSRAGNTLDWTARPACLHYEGDLELKNGKAIVTGWGRLGYGEDVPPVLQKVSLSVLDNSVCNKTFEDGIRDTRNLPRGIDSGCLCAGEADTSLGDIGGPLQLTNYDGTCVTQLIGITSFGKFCGFREIPAVYMRVKHYVSWIESVVWP